MNNPKVLLLIVLLYGLPVTAMSQLDAVASDTSRWGVTTQKKLEKRPGTALDHTDLEANQAAPGRQNSKSATGSKQNKNETVINNTDPSIKSTKQKHPPSMKPSLQGKALNSPSSPSHSSGLEGKNVTSSEKDARPSTKAMVWVDEHQKMTCQNYLKDLRERFLKTRHYSIQGASCQTREYASAFLQTRDKCTKDCPQGFLSRNGYTDRIIRNITYLEKIGKDRCDDTNDNTAMPRTK